MIQYINVDYNFQTCASVQARIAKIDAVIDSLLNVALISVGNGDTVQYSLDTGQTKIQKTYSDPTAITNALQQYNRIRQYYVNQITPRSIRLVNNTNFR